MVGEKIGGSGELRGDQGNDKQDAGKKVLELSVIPEGMTVEQYEDFLNGMTDKFGNPALSTSTRETLVGKYAKGELMEGAVNPIAEASAEQIRKANEAAERDQQAEIERILAGREATEALNSINNELQELEWARWNLEQFLASHWDRLTSEGTTTYSQQLDTIKSRMQELGEDKGTLEREFNLAEKALPDMGERAAVDTNEPILRDQAKMMSALGQMLEKTRDRERASKVEMLTTEVGAQPSPEEFTEEKQRAEWLQTLKNATDPRDPNAFKPGEWMSDEEKAELKAEQREALKKQVAEKVGRRAPFRRLATQALAGVLLAGTLFGVIGSDANAAEIAENFGEGKSPKEEDGGDVATKNKVATRERLNKFGLGVQNGSEALKAIAKTSEQRDVDQSFAEWALVRGNEIYDGFEDEEGTQIGKFGEMANYTKGWDLNKPGSNHFGPSLAVLVDQAIEEGKAPEEALPGVIEGILQNYRNQPECNMAYISSFPALLAECGVSEDIINIQDIDKRTDALIDLWHSKEGGADLQKKLMAATELTFTSEYTSMDLFRSNDKVWVDYLRLKPGQTKSGIGHMEIDQDVKQRKGEWALTITYGDKAITVFLRCGGQKGKKMQNGQKKRYVPTVVTIETENLTEDEVELLQDVVQAVAEDSDVVITEESEQSDDEESQDEEEDDEEDQEQDDEEEEEQEQTDDSKKPENAKIVLGEVKDGILDQTEDVAKVEVETELENVQPTGESQNQVIENIVEDNKGDANKQAEIDAGTNNEDIIGELAEIAAIMEATNSMNGVPKEGEGQ